MVEKQTVVIVHGWGRGESLARWQPVKQALTAAGFTVYLPILPGFFGSRPPVPPWKLKDYADYLTQYCAQQHLKAPLLFLGHSFGGSVVIKLALAHPQLVKALILVNSAGIRPALGLKAKAFRILAKVGKTLLWLPPLIFIRPLARWLLYTLAGAKDYYHAQKLLRPTLINILRQDLTPVLSKVTQPTLLVWGGQDTTTPLDSGRLFHRLLPHATLKIFHLANHGLPFSHPKDLSLVVTDFVARL